MGIFDRLRRAPRDATTAPRIRPGGQAAGPEDASPRYLSPEDAAVYLRRDAAGHLPVVLREFDGEGWLVHTASGSRINPGNRSLTAAGLFTLNLRGIDYHRAAVRATDTRPGADARLVREPDHEHDERAIAVQALDPDGGTRTVGYVNRGLAARLAKRLDAGEQTEALFIRGSRPGSPAQRVSVAISDPGTIRRL